MSDFESSSSCATFEARLSEYLESQLPDLEQRFMDAHILRCARCAKLLEEVHFIVAEATRLPPLNPSRDLWPGIVSRLDTSVTSIDAARSSSPSVRPARRISLRVFAAAAVALITVSSGATYLLTRGANTKTATPATSNATPSNTAGDASNSKGAQFIAVGNRSAESTYEHEIVAMRRIVNGRLGDLDSTTVVEIERNLAIIDKAIADSRKALDKDPRSRFLSTQLNRALENKLDVLRHVALL